MIADKWCIKQYGAFWKCYTLLYVEIQLALLILTRWIFSTNFDLFHYTRIPDDLCKDQNLHEFSSPIEWFQLPHNSLSLLLSIESLLIIFLFIEAIEELEKYRGREHIKHKKIYFWNIQFASLNPRKIKYLNRYTNILKKIYHSHSYSAVFKKNVIVNFTKWRREKNGSRHKIYLFFFFSEHFSTEFPQFSVLESFSDGCKKRGASHLEWL